MADEKIPGVRPYDKPAGGWGALKAVAGALADQETVIEGGKTLLQANQLELRALAMDYHQRAVELGDESDTLELRKLQTDLHPQASDS